MSNIYVKDKVPLKTVQNYKNYTADRLVSNLPTVDWNDVYEESNINVAISIFTRTVLNMLCPLSKISSNNHHRKFISKKYMRSNGRKR